MAHACPFFGSCSTEQQSTGQGGEKSTYKRMFYVHLYRLTRLPIDSPQLIINDSESSFHTLVTRIIRTTFVRVAFSPLAPFRQKLPQKANLRIQPFSPHPAAGPGPAKQGKRHICATIVVSSQKTPTNTRPFRKSPGLPLFNLRNTVFFLQLSLIFDRNHDI